MGCAALLRPLHNEEGSREEGLFLDEDSAGTVGHGVGRKLVLLSSVIHELHHPRSDWQTIIHHFPSSHVYFLWIQRKDVREWKGIVCETVASNPQSLFLQHFSDQPPCSLSEEEMGLSQVV